MRFIAISGAVLALCGSVLAQTPGFDAITKPTNLEVIPAGSTYDITWEPGTQTGTVTVVLIGGATQDTQNPIATLGSGIPNANGHLAWNVDPTYGTLAVYGLQIFLEPAKTTFQYSFPFHIKPVSGGGSSSSSSSTTSGSSSSTSSGSSKSTTTTTSVVSTSSSTGSVKSTTTTTGATSSTTVTSVSSSGSSSASSTFTTTTSTSIPSGGNSTISSATLTSKTTTSATSVSTAGAHHVAAGSFAVLGGLAAMAFAL